MGVYLLWHSVFATYLGCLNLKELKHFILKDLVIISVCMCASVEVKDNFVDLSFHTYVDSEDWTEVTRLARQVLFLTQSSSPYIWNLKAFIWRVCVCAHACMLMHMQVCMCDMVIMWRLDDNFWESFFSFYHVDSGDCHWCPPGNQAWQQASFTSWAFLLAPV